MKRNKLYYLSAFLLFAVGIMPKDARYASAKYYIFLLIFVISSALLQKVKNTKLLSGMIFLISAATTIYGYEYLFFAVPPLFLMLGYRLICDEAQRKEKSSVPYIFITFISKGISIIAVIYAVLTNGYKSRSFIAFYKETIDFVWIIPLFAFLCYSFKNKGYSKDKLTREKEVVFNNNLKTAFFSIVATLFYIYYSCFFYNEPSYIILCYWSAYIIFVLFYKERHKRLLSFL